jgi:hypothetical protein
MNTPRERGLETASWLFIWTFVAVLGAYGIRTQLQRERTKLRVELDARVERSMQKGQNDISGFEQDLKLKAREAEARRRTELENVWGGRRAAALKNPAFSLREALAEAAKACAPTNAIAYADVDRITEFTATVDSGEIISTNDMVAFARSFLPLANKYVDSVRFSHKGDLIAEIDRQDIEFIDDWTRASDQRIAMLLPRESQSRIVQDPATIERYKNEQRIAEAMAADPSLREKAERADRKLRQAIENAYNELNAALDSARGAVAAGNIRSLRDLDRSEKALNAAAQNAEKARMFWNDPPREWEKLLASEGISGELYDALLKGFPGMFRNNPVKTKKVLEAMDREIQSSRFALRLLITESDKWKFSGGNIALTDDDFARAFEKAFRQVREDQLETQEALRAWQEAVGP